MAVAFRSSAGASNVLATVNSAPSVSSPAGVVAGDIILLIYSQGGLGLNPTITWPAGFTQIFAQRELTPDDKKHFAAYKTATGSEPATYAPTVTGSGSDLWTLTAIAFNGWSGAAPTFALSAQTTATASPTSIAATGLTCTSGDAVLWLAVQSNNDLPIWTFTPPAGFTTRQYLAADAYHASVAASREGLPAGATGTLTGSMSGSGSTGWVAAVVRVPSATPLVPVYGSLGQFDPTLRIQGWF